MTYQLSKREYDALQLSGFSSVEELLKRYFELIKEANSAKHAVDAVGSDKCQLNLDDIIKGRYRSVVTNKFYDEFREYHKQ